MLTLYISAYHSPAQATSLDELDAIESPDEPPPLEPPSQPMQVLRGTWREPLSMGTVPSTIPAPRHDPAFVIPETPSPFENMNRERDPFATYRSRCLGARAPSEDDDMPPPPTPTGRANGPPAATPTGRVVPRRTPVGRVPRRGESWRVGRSVFSTRPMPHTPALPEETSESGVSETESSDELSDDDFLFPFTISPMRMDFERLADRVTPTTGPPPDWTDPQLDGPPPAPVNRPAPPFNPWVPNGPIHHFRRRIPPGQPMVTDSAQFGGNSMLEQAMTAVWGLSRMRRVGRRLDRTLVRMNFGAHHVELPPPYDAAYIGFLREYTIDVMRDNNEMEFAIRFTNDAFQDVVIHVACACHQTTCAKAR